MSDTELYSIKGYTVFDQIHEGGRTAVFRARADDDQSPVVLKFYKSEFPSFRETENVEREFRLLNGLDLPGVIRVRALENFGNNKVLVMEDYGAISLESYLKKSKLNVGEFLEWAIAIVGTLDQIHRANVIHKNINPHHILVNETTKETKLVDFSIASEVKYEIRDSISAMKLEGTLPYVSPEQTGRMNRTIDFRTDFYSLGVTFYEMLSGRLPFVSRDPLEMIHAHIARIPESPSRVSPNVPDAVSNIVLKLMAKKAEERYQSDRGILADLERCRAMATTGAIAEFPLGGQDYSDVFRIPEKLYGREKEIAALLGKFESAAASEGSPSILFITGAPGIGKSSIIRELHKPLLAKRGYFISGKYDQYKRDLPFHAIITAYKELIDRLLMETEEEIALWKARMIENLGNMANVVIEVIPQLKLIMGEQPPVVGLSPSDAENRFNYAFLNFTRVFASKDYPLVLFLDDLQWADNASLKWLKFILKNSDLKSFIFVGSYRDNEVPPGHPLHLVFDSLRKADVEYDDIKLQPLETEDIAQLLIETLKENGESILELSEIVRDKTGGNPFFVNEFVKSLHSEQWITFDNGWKLDLKSIAQARITDNIVEFMAGKIVKLPADTQEIMKIASCEGNAFRFLTLAEITGRGESAVLDALKPAINEGLILKLDGTAQFNHDRIREAVYGLVEDDLKTQYHYRLGKCRMPRPEDPLREKIIHDEIFQIVQHLNLAEGALKGADERIELATLNLKAGIKAKNSTAFEAASRYLRMGLSLLPADSWKSQYALALQLHTECGEAEYLAGNHDASERLFQDALNNARNPLEKTKILIIQMFLYLIIYRLDVALSLGIKACNLLGVKMPKKANQLKILLKLLKVKAVLGKRNIESLLDLPELKEAYPLEIAKILMHMSLPAYMGFPDYAPIIVLKLVDFSIRNGNSAFSAYAYIVYGIILCYVFNDIESGYRFGELALKLGETIDIDPVRCKVLFLFGNFVNHWKNPIREDIAFLEEAYETGMETGDLIYASYAINMNILHTFFTGENIEAARTKGARYFSIMKKLKQSDTIDLFSLGYQYALILSGDASNPLSIRGDLFDEDVTVPKWIKNKQLTDMGHYTIFKLLLNYLYGEYPAAVQIAEKGKRYIAGVQGMFHFKDYFYYYALSLLAEYRNVGLGKRRTYRRRIRQFMSKIDGWAKLAPSNCRHKALFLRAEWSAIRGSVKEAAALYENAISEARANGFINEEALILERAALFYDSLDLRRISESYMRSAFAAFKNWGAIGKCRALKERYPYLSKSMPDEEPGDAVSGAEPSESAFLTRTVSIESLKSGIDSLDISTVMKASNAISGEIHLDKLIDRMITIVMENAGAQKAVLVLNKENRLVIEAMGLAGGEGVRPLGSMPLEDCALVPESVIRYVARTKKNVVLNNALLDGFFNKDGYIRDNRVKSLLCHPFINKGAIVGIIYLENNLADSVFREERLQIIDILSGQIGISLENAALYEQLLDYSKNLEEKVRERTVKLEDANKKLKTLDLLKNDFIANITHDFRSPLTIILNVADLALRFNSEMDEETRENYNVIYQSSLRLENSIDKLLNLAKLDAQGIKLKVKKVELVSFLDTLLNYYSSSVLISGIKIVRHLPEREIDDFYTDLEKLEEILDNILSNAIKFINPTTGVITVDLADAGGAVTIRIADNGIGIPRNKLEMIFNRFEQAVVKQEAHRRGTGIGLAYSKQLTEYLKGRIWAESDGENQGARFFVELPKDRSVFDAKDFSDEEALPVGQPEKRTLIANELREKIENTSLQTHFVDLNREQESDYKKGVILIIDDDRKIREILVQYLLNNGYKNYILASDGIQGLEAVYEHSPDLIICDFVMPKFKGDYIHNQIVGSPKYREIPFIFLSAAVNDGLIMERREKGAVAFLKKPIDGKLLMITVEEHLKRYFEYRRVMQLTSIDELTGLNNRRSIIENLNRELAVRKYRDLSVVFMDIDFFKEINDKNGHLAGDRILHAVGATIKSTIRTYDIGARYGGDEFLIILPDTGLSDAVHVSEEVKKRIDGLKVEYQNKPLDFSSSFGVASLKTCRASIEEDLGIKNLEELFEVRNKKNADWDAIERIKGKIPELLMKMADEALYRAKRSHCTDCGFSSLIDSPFAGGACPACGSGNLERGRNRIARYSPEDG